MKFGVFDHMDDAGVPLGQLYADRLQLLEAYDRAGLHGYHLAEHHSTPLGCAASGVRSPVCGLSGSLLLPGDPEREELCRPETRG